MAGAKCTETVNIGTWYERKCAYPAREDGRCKRHLRLLGKHAERGLKPRFTREQLEWLRRTLTPPCCHVSGEHDPTHFEERPEKVCYLQKRDAYDRTLKALDFATLQGKSEPDCGWCQPAKKR